jgi:hypothetical protein
VRVNKEVVRILEDTSSSSSSNKGERIITVEQLKSKDGQYKDATQLALIVDTKNYRDWLDKHLQRIQNAHGICHLHFSDPVVFTLLWKKITELSFYSLNRFKDFDKPLRRLIHLPHHITAISLFGVRFNKHSKLGDIVSNSPSIEEFSIEDCTNVRVDVIGSMVGTKKNLTKLKLPFLLTPPPCSEKIRTYDLVELVDVENCVPLFDRERVFDWKKISKYPWKGLYTLSITVFSRDSHRLFKALLEGNPNITCLAVRVVEFSVKDVNDVLGEFGRSVETLKVQSSSKQDFVLAYLPNLVSLELENFYVGNLIYSNTVETLVLVNCKKDVKYKKMAKNDITQKDMLEYFKYLRTLSHFRSYNTKRRKLDFTLYRDHQE